MPKKNKYPLSNNSLKDFPNIKDLPSNHYGLNQVMTTDDKNRLWRWSGPSEKEFSHKALIEANKLQIKTLKTRNLNTNNESIRNIGNFGYL